MGPVLDRWIYNFKMRCSYQQQLQILYWLSDDNFQPSVRNVNDF